MFSNKPTLQQLAAQRETWHNCDEVIRLIDAELDRRERRLLFISAMRRPEMRLLRLALRHLLWDKGIDWRAISEIHVEQYTDDAWMLTTDKYLVCCFQTHNPALTYEDFSLIYLHQQDNPACPCEFCVVDRQTAQP